MNSVRESLKVMSDFLWVLPLFCFLWVVNLCLRPVKTLKFTRHMLSREYSVPHSAVDHETDWIDELCWEDRR